MVCEPIADGTAQVRSHIHTYTHLVYEWFVNHSRAHVYEAQGSIPHSAASTYFIFQIFDGVVVLKIFLNEIIHLYCGGYPTFQTNTIFFISDLYNFLEHTTPLRKFSLHFFEFRENFLEIYSKFKKLY